MSGQFIIKIAVLCFAINNIVMAQGLEEIVVTAQKKSESLQDVPIAVSVLTGDSLAERGSTNVYDLASVTPTLVIGRDKGSVNIYLRGVGNSFVSQGVDGSVAVHQDGVYLSRPRSQVASFFDLERVEVLRGPQGTLYGRNATGGSLNLITKGPSDEREGNIRLTLGSKSLVELEGGFGGPISDTLTGRLAFISSQRDGFGTNVVTGNDVLDKDELGVRGKLRWEASEDVTVNFSADYWRADDAAFGTHNFGAVDHPLDGVIANLNRIPIVPEGGGAPVPNPAAIPFVAGSGDPDYFWDVASDLDFKRDAEVAGAMVDVAWEINDALELRSITAYRTSDASSISDVDGSPVRAAQLNEREESDWFSQELHLKYTGVNNELLFGFYYFDESQEGSLVIPWYYTGIQGDRVSFQGEMDTKAYALFVNYSHDLTDQLTLTVGGRYSDEEKNNRGDFFFQNLIAGNINPPGLPLSSPRSVVLPFDNENDWSAFTPQLTVDYKFSDDSMVFASVSKGFKSGQYSLGDIVPAANPEHVISYQLGLKTRFWDNRGQANLTAFMYDYEDIQFQVIRAGSPAIENAAEAKILGLEGEFSFAMTDTLLLNLNIGILDTEYNNAFITDPFLAPGTPDVDVSGNQLVSAPDLTATFSISKDFMLETGEINVRFDYRYTDEIFFTPFNNDFETQDAYSDLGLRLSYRSQDDNWGFSVWGRNLTDEEVKVGLSSFPPWLGSSQGGGVNNPRHFGVDFTYRF